MASAQVRPPNSSWPSRPQFSLWSRCCPLYGSHVGIKIRLQTSSLPNHLLPPLTLPASPSPSGDLGSADSQLTTRGHAHCSQMSRFPPSCSPWQPGSQMGLVFSPYVLPSLKFNFEVSIVNVIPQLWKGSPSKCEYL